MKTRSMDLLDVERIRQGMSPAAQARLRELTLLAETDSTNSAVMRIPGDSQHAHGVLAERQTGGRGRRQKSWYSPPGGNIYLSVGWRFDSGTRPLSTLPLVVAVAACKALSRAGLQGHGIKWPNDILTGGKKLVGILVELRSAGSDPALAVIGVGVNVKMPDPESDPLLGCIDRPWTDLATELGSGSQEIDRNRLSGLLLEELTAALEQFEIDGFTGFRESWQSLDLMHGKSIRVERNGKQIAGEARGVNENGELLLQTLADGLQVFNSGEVSIQYD